MTPEDIERKRIAVDREMVHRFGLVEFVKRAWRQVHPVTYVHNWHIDEVCNHLEAVSRCELTRLVINIPPGTAKTSLCSIFWPVWEWIKNPATCWIYASYDRGLMGDAASKALDLMRSDWFVARWGQIVPSQEKLAVNDYTNLHKGFRFSTSPGGAVTGRHADIHVVDDPIKPKDVVGGPSITKTVLKNVSEWYRSTMATRFKDAATSRRVLVMQRLHTDDLAGECIEQGYQVLRLPMRFEESTPCRTKWGGDRRTEPGELLFPAKFPEASVRKLEGELADAAPAQLQQRPTAEGGQVFREEFWRYWHPTMPGCLRLPDDGWWINSWDLAFKKTETTDRVSGGAWLGAQGLYWLVDTDTQRRDFPGSLGAIRRMFRQYPRTAEVLIEDKANGPAAETMLRDEIPCIVMVNPKGGKTARAHATSNLGGRFEHDGSFTEGRVVIPHPSLVEWVSPYLVAHQRFPLALHDDEVDMTTQALLHFRESGELFSRAMAAVMGKK